MTHLLRSVTALVLAVALFGGTAARHTHSGAECIQCIFAPSGRRSPDVPGIEAMELLAVRQADRRTSSIIFRTPVRHVVVQRSFRSVPIGIPEIARAVRPRAPTPRRPQILEGGLYGRAPPTFPVA